MFYFFLFRWTLKLFKTGRKRDLEVNDLYTTLNDHSSAILGNELEKYIKKSQISELYQIYLYIFHF